MYRRRQEEIQKDYWLCKKYIDSHPRVSIKEIAKAVHLSESKVKTSLRQNPRDFEKNMEKIFKVVIDASITGVKDFEDIIKDILKEKIIVLTTITIEELGKLQKYNDTSGRDARNILSMAAENQKDFECVVIDETLETPDDCIIKYCADNKSNVILFTADKTMDLKARAFGVKTKFFKQPKSAENSMKKPHKKVSTLYEAKRNGNELKITCFVGKFKSIKVISNGIQYSSGSIALKNGDNVYIGRTTKDDCIFFIHYGLNSTDEENNCKIIYFKKIYNKGQIRKLPKEKYKSFIREFINEGKR